MYIQEAQSLPFCPKVAEELVVPYLQLRQISLSIDQKERSNSFQVYKIKEELEIASFELISRDDLLGGYWSLNVLFCSGSRTSRSADAGSPRMSEPVLSISSSNITGLETPTF